jgi:hypothetical protein
LELRRITPNPNPKIMSDKQYVSFVFEIIDIEAFSEAGNPLRMTLPGLKCVGVSSRPRTCRKLTRGSKKNRDPNKIMSDWKQKPAGRLLAKRVIASKSEWNEMFYLRQNPFLDQGWQTALSQWWKKGFLDGVTVGGSK